MRVIEKQCNLGRGVDINTYLFRIAGAVQYPIRSVIYGVEDEDFLGAIAGASFPIPYRGFTKMERDDGREFIAALLIPTGIGLEVGGHAGDAGPAARAIGAACDRIMLHPNVVNASDLNGMPANSLYCEGYAFESVLMGAVGIIPKRKNRVLVLLENHSDKTILGWSINAVNGARAAWGLDAQIELIGSPPKVKARINGQGRATGSVEDLEPLLRQIEARLDQFDSFAISTTMDVGNEIEVNEKYFSEGGVNPWGGAEAILTHTLTAKFGKQFAHAPMVQSQKVFNLNLGIVDPRQAAEAVSFAYLNCILRGLAVAPAISRDKNGITAANISALIVPRGTLGLPYLAAIGQGMPTIHVENEAANPVRLTDHFPVRPGLDFFADSYIEAAGILCCLRAGIDPRTIDRPIQAEGVWI